MKLLWVLPVLLVVGFIPTVFAETETFEYDTTPYGIYTLHFDYEGEGKFEIFLEDRKLGDGIGGNDRDSSTIEFTTDKESVEIRIVSENINVVITDLEYTGQLSSEQIESNFPTPHEDPKDLKILELEQRILILENEKTELEIINDGLQNQINNLREQLENANAIMQEQLKVIIETLKNLKLN